MSSDIEMIDPPPRSASMAASSSGREYDSAVTLTPTPNHKHFFNHDGESGSASGVEIEAELERDDYDSASEREERDEADEEHDDDQAAEGDNEDEHEAEFGDHEGGEGVEHEGDEDNSDSSSSEEDSEEDDEEGEGAEAEVDTSTGQVQPRLPSVVPSAPSSTPAPAQPRSPKRMSIDLLVNPSPSAAGPSKSISPTSSAPPPPPPATSIPPAPSQKKPRSKRTPSPPPPPPAAPLQTVRLEIKLGGPTNYEVDISRLAKESGQRAPSPIRVLPVEDPGEVGASEGEVSGKGKKRKKKAATSEYYDISDPFIDDSELALDDRKWFAQTKQQGFYVSSGEVALLKDRSPKKPKSKKNPLVPTSTSTAPLNPDSSIHTPNAPPGSISAPPNLNGFGVEDDEKAGQKRKRYVTVVEAGKKRKIVDVNSFHPQLKAGIEELKKAIQAESWTQKGKFPANIKPLLAKLAMDAIKLDEYDEHFFNLMPTLFPYNKFTMMKLIKRTVFQDHINLLTERQDILLAELTGLVKEGFPKAEEEYEKAMIVWDKREKGKQEIPTNSADPASTTPTRHTTEEMDVDNPPASTAGAGYQEKEHDNKPPQKRYRLSDRMKTIVWQLVCLSNECCRLENEKNGLEGSVIQVSEQGGRKVLYQKIVAAFPDGWMNSGQISRDVSVMKKKIEKEQMENET